MVSKEESAVPSDLKSRMKSCYDAIAIPYKEALADDDDPTRGKYISQLIQLLQKTDPGKISVLELGCGAGVPGTKMLLDTKYPEIHVFGNDLSSVQLDLARQRLGSFEKDGRLELTQGDMMDLKFPDESFHAVVALYSIIHLPRGEQTELLGRIVKWLKPGGFLLANFAQEAFANKVDPQWLGQEQGWVYWSGWGEEGSVKMVEEAGLSIVVREVSGCEADAFFVWIIAKKG